jgi:hypothetical protein
MNFEGSGNCSRRDWMREIHFRILSNEKERERGKGAEWIAL